MVDAGIVTIAALAALDAVLGPQNNLSGSFGVAPFLTAVGGHPGATAVVAVLALDVSSVLAVAASPAAFSPRPEQFVDLVAVDP